MLKSFGEFSKKESKTFQRTKKESDESVDVLGKIKFNLISLEKEIANLIENFSAETFRKARKEKTVTIGGEGFDMEYYSAKIKDFRDEEWFKNLNPEEQEKVELWIINFIHQKILIEADKLNDQFFQTLSSQVQEYFENNKKLEKNFLLPSDKLKDEVIKAIYQYKEYFGFFPDSPETLSFNCVGFVNFMGEILKHYGFSGSSISIPGHVAFLIKLRGNKSYVSDVNFSQVLSFRDWIEKMKEFELIKGNRDINIGYFGEYESNIHYNLGIFLEAIGNFKESEKEFREAIKMNPNLDKAHVNLGVLLLKLDRNKESEEELRKAIRINPNLAEAHSQLGFLLFFLDRYEESEEEFRKAIGINPNIGEVHLQLGILLASLKQYDEAIKEILEAKKIFKKNNETDLIDKCNELLKYLKFYKKT